MDPIKISPGGEFSLGGENFVIEGEVPTKDRRPSTSEAFTIVKSEPYRHAYEDTKASFEFLFPLLQPGGIYLIEDWSWAHHPNYQSPDAPFSNRHALSNLLFEQIMLLGSTSVISEIRVWRFLYLIRKAKSAVRRTDVSQNLENGSIFDQILSRGRKWSLI